MTYIEVLQTLRSLAPPKREDRLFPPLKVYDEKLGISLTNLRELSKTIKRNHSRALKLWEAGIHEAKLLATLTEEANQVTEEQLDRQVNEINAITVAEYFTKNVVAKTPHLLSKANSWTFMNQPSMVRHVGYSCVCQLAKHSKILDNNYFEKHLTIIDIQLKKATGLVKDAQINALIAIGSRNKHLNKKAQKIGDKVGKLTTQNAKRSKNVDLTAILRSSKIQAKL